MKTFQLHMIALFLATALLGACSGSSLFRKNPGEVLRAFLMAGNAGQYSTAEQYLTPSMKTVVTAFGGIKHIMDQETRNGKIDRIQILTTQVRGQGAHVTYRIYYKGGQTRDDDDDLIQIHGNWRISQ